ncbi:phospho-acceptor domain-containing protein [Kineococcus xinjiangensis]|uniref:Sensor-like histidine kinase SenX3 n=1 Tax=Kineococcus xinjiangensis TaxID=512762 RepID=A0A2S6ID20_9ACTN|nr:ATP-binding protein [Kineococcus xinjiangensis]PPK92101.1 phospho-acceptor domain-containing protein [Kineococcus xinjiangensis]
MQDDERRRVAALREYRILDAPADAEVEAVVRLAAAIAGVPTATLNLLDDRRQHQHSTVGFEAADCAREDSMCHVRFAEKSFVHLPDATLEPEYADGPFVSGELGSIRFYAAAPLITPAGHSLGTLCVFDGAPRSLDEEQIARLEDLAGIVVGLFERRREARRSEALAAESQEQHLLFELTMRELELRQEFTDAVLDTIDVGVVASDARGRLTMSNRAARDLHGLDADDSVEPSEHAERYSLFDADGITLLKPEQVPLHRALHEGRVDAVEMVVAPPGRRPATVLASGRALHRHDGSLLGAVAVLSDVTAARAHQAAIEATSAQLTRRTAELERSNRDLEQFAAITSHDLASPLTVVGGYVEMVRDIYAGSLDEQALDWLTTAHNGVHRMKGLIGALLTYARAGGAVCEREVTDSREVFDQAVVDLRTSVKDAAARVTAPAALPVLFCDPTLLRQLLQNLIGNSIKYRHPERPCRVVVTAAATDDGWEFAVADNGRGIPAERREDVFGMFSMVRPGERTGHGIGLATCQRIVERHGGRIWVDPAPATGTVVRFTLPQRTQPRD